MSKRVHEIAKELGLNSKEVIGRLKDAGVEVKSHSSSVEDPSTSGSSARGTPGPTVPPTAARPPRRRRPRRPARRPEKSGHGATIQEAPAEKPVSDVKKGRNQKKRRRVVIDASARNRGARPTAAPVAPREQEAHP
jgi:translation initiation factor IF-2